MDSTRILIVEDETIIALELKGRLDSLGYTVVAAVSSGEKALQKTGSEHPDLVLMDMRLKGQMDGIETAAIIRSRYDIPVVFLTAYLDDDRLERAKLAMPFGYLLKPVQERELKVSIEMALYTAKVDRQQRKTELALNQRVKELECFYGISRLTETPDISLDELLRQVIQLVSQSWQFPEITHSRIVFKSGKTIFCPHGPIEIFEKWSQKIDIKVQNKKIGELIVFYSEERPKADEKVFLKEERYLLNSLGERLGNVIERFEMQKELKDTKNKLQSIIESSFSIFYVHDTEHQLTYLSPQVNEILGYEVKEAMINWNLLTTDHPINQKALEITQRAIDTGVKQPPYQLELKHKSGRKVWCEIKENPIKLSGKVVSIAGSVTDITAKKAAEETLQSSERRFQKILETAPIGIQFSDPQGVITYVNEAHQKTHSLTADKLIGRQVWTLNSDKKQEEDEKQQYLLSIKNKVNHPTLTIFEKKIEDRNIDLVINRSNLFNQKNEIEEVCSFITDVSEATKIEKALREHEEKYHTLFELGSDFLALIEIETGSMLEVNQSFLNHYGYTREEVLSMKNTDFSAEPEKTKATTEGLEKRVPIRWHKKKDGTIFPVEIIANVFEYNGRMVHIAAIRDISLRIEAEEKIKASLKEKETLLQEIHHRVKNNLSVMTSLINLQSSKTKDIAVKKILRDSQNRLQAMSLVHKFLYQSENLSAINVRDYITDLVSMIRQSFETTGRMVKIALKIEDHTINADLASPMGLIINELITNSIKYAFPETTDNQITISYRLTGKKTIKLEVGDNGIGMPTGFDWKKTDTLGLSLVNTLVQDQLDGSITFQSKKGTTCTIMIPEQSTGKE